MPSRSEGKGPERPLGRAARLSPPAPTGLPLAPVLLANVRRQPSQRHQVPQKPGSVSLVESKEWTERPRGHHGEPGTWPQPPPAPAPGLNRRPIPFRTPFPRRRRRPWGGMPQAIDHLSEAPERTGLPCRLTLTTRFNASVNPRAPHTFPLVLGTESRLASNGASRYPRSPGQSAHGRIWGKGRWSMSSVLVTGATGSVGGNVVCAAERTVDLVRALVRIFAAAGPLEALRRRISNRAMSPMPNRSPRRPLTWTGSSTARR